MSKKIGDIGKNLKNLGGDMADGLKKGAENIGKQVEKGADIGKKGVKKGVDLGKKGVGKGVDLGKKGVDLGKKSVSEVVKKGKSIKDGVSEKLQDIPVSKIKPPSLERFGVWYFKRKRKRTPRLKPEMAVHILSKAERRKLKQIEISAMVKAAIAGAISAAVAAWANMQKFHLIDDEVKAVITWDDYYEYYLFVGSITLLITIAEIGFIYWDSLRSVFKISHVANIPLFPDGENSSTMALALARAALELPNPIESDLGVNPNRESPKWKIIIAPIVYKLKIAVTNFIAKMIIRRTIGRGVARVYVEFIAVPVSAFWNAFVSWRVIRQARIRAIGPSFALDFVNKLLAERESFSEEAQLQMTRAIGSVVVRTENLHPNLEYLLHVMISRFKLASTSELDNTNLFIDHLTLLKDEEQEYVLQMLVVATMISGKVTRRNKKLLIEAFERCGYVYDHNDVKALIKEFFSGEPIQFPLLQMKLS